nr:MAG TPA: hypothetical protein [Caudoviricetes sp.]
MSNHLSSHTAKRSRTSYCTPKKKVGERERERERERESTEQAKIEINNKINEIYKIGVFRIGNSNFSVERKRIELAIYYEKIIKYIIYNNTEEHPIDYLDSIGC